MSMSSATPRRYPGIIYVQPCDPTDISENDAVSPGQFWLKTSTTSADPYPILFIRGNFDGNDFWQRLTAPGIITCTELPIATVELRGHMRLLLGEVETADSVHICVKNASDQYYWQPL